MSGQHALLAPSAASIWGPCPGSAVLAPLYPQEETDATREGTASHWCGAEVLAGRVPAANAVAPNGVVINQEMIDGAMVWVEDVRKVIGAGEGVQIWDIESRVKSERIHADHCWGTTDSYVYIVAPKRKLVVWDYKYGHREVDPTENPQLTAYAAGLIDEVCKIDTQLEVEFRIVQPRCFTASGPVRVWRTTGTDLRNAINKLSASAHEALGDNPRTVSGNHCIYCPAIWACPTARNASMTSLDYIGRALPEPLTPEAISFEINMLERAAAAVDARLTSMKEQAKTTLRSGKIVPGYGLQETVGNLAWNKTPDELRALGAAYGITLEKPNQFITPTQAKQKGIDEFVISAYADRAKTGLKLVVQDTSRITRILNGDSNG